MPRRIDDIGFGGYKLIQDTDLYCYGTDAVLLSKFCNALHKDNMLDMCCGNGIIPLIADALYKPKSITGIEIQLASYLLAEENAVLNNLADKIRFICGDILHIREIISPESFDLVTCNPPYFVSDASIGCENEAMHIARHETGAGLEDFISAASYVLKKGGRLCMVHRPSRLSDVMEFSRRYGLEPKRLQMVYPHEGENANIMLVECVKGAGKELKVLPGIVLH